MTKQAEQVKHADTPWKLVEDGLGIVAEHNKYISVMSGNWSKGEGEANAKFIVKAVNNHDALVEALEALINTAEEMGWASDEKDGTYFPELEQAKQTLVQARGE